MRGLFDSHAHLQDPAFAGDVDAAVERARAAGVTGIVVLGYDPRSNHAALEIAARHPGIVFPAVGIHPHDAASVTDGDLEEVAALARLDQVVAIGEIGLDFYRNLSPAANQVEVLERHLTLALDLGKPVSVHSRSAEEGLTEPLERFAADWSIRFPGRSPGVMHCFGGTSSQAATFVAAGFHVSIACSITYPRNDQARAVAAEIPLERLLIETDSPYLPPQPLRGRRNEPAHVGAAAAAIASVRGCAPTTIANATAANAERLFGVHVGLPSPVGQR